MVPNVTFPDHEVTQAGEEGNINTRKARGGGGQLTGTDGRRSAGDLRHGGLAGLGAAPPRDGVHGRGVGDGAPRRRRGHQELRAAGPGAQRGGQRDPAGGLVVAGRVRAQP